MHICRIFPEEFLGNCQNLPWTFPGHLTEMFQEMSWPLNGFFLVMPWTFTGSFPTISETDPGQFPEIPKRLPNVSQKYPRPFPDSGFFQKFAPVIQHKIQDSGFLQNACLTRLSFPETLSKSSFFDSLASRETSEGTRSPSQCFQV